VTENKGIDKYQTKTAFIKLNCLAFYCFWTHLFLNAFLD
jgi:hypothetical protein